MLDIGDGEAVKPFIPLLTKMPLDADEIQLLSHEHASFLFSVQHGSQRTGEALLFYREALHLHACDGSTHSVRSPEREVMALELYREVYCDKSAYYTFGRSG